MKTLAQLLEKDLVGARVLLRADLNVPMNENKVLDNTRILQHKKTINALVDKGAKVILLSHFGRPGGIRKRKFSLSPILGELRKTLSCEVGYIPDCVGTTAVWGVNRSKNQVLLVENTRFHPGESKNDPNFAKELAKLGDFYVNDAFSVSHRAHASTSGIASILPSFAGLALTREIEELEKYLTKPALPALAIIAGSKITGKSSKVGLLLKLLKQMNVVAIGGAMANTFLIALGKMKNVSANIDEEAIEIAKNVMATAEKVGCKIVLPIDVVAALNINHTEGAKNCSLDEIPDGWGCFDIGTKSINAIEAEIDLAKTILWNGPLGAFETEPFNNSSFAIAKKIAASEAISVAGGGETVGAINLAQSTRGFSYISTAGGAFLSWLKREPLPALEALRD